MGIATLASMGLLGIWLGQGVGSRILSIFAILSAQINLSALSAMILSFLSIATAWLSFTVFHHAIYQNTGLLIWPDKQKLADILADSFPMIGFQRTYPNDRMGLFLITTAWMLNPVSWITSLVEYLRRLMLVKTDRIHSIKLIINWIFLAILLPLKGLAGILNTPYWLVNKIRSIYLRSEIEEKENADDDTDDDLPPLVPVSEEKSDDDLPPLVSAPLISADSKDHEACDHSSCGHVHEKYEWQKGIAGVLWGVGLMLLALLNYDPSSIIKYCITGATALVTLYLGKGTYKSAYDKFFNAKKWDEKFTMDTLYTISTLTIMIVSIAGLFIPNLPHMFEAAPFILGLSYLGKHIESSLKRKVEKTIKITDIAPKFVSKINANGNLENENYRVDQLEIDDFILVKKGQFIPVDGICLEEVIELNTQKINGENYKIFKKEEEIKYVKSGMQILSPESVKIKVTKKISDSYLFKLDQSILKARTNREESPIEKHTGIIFKYFVPTLLFAAIFLGVVLGFVSGLDIGLESGIALAVSLCPCALRFITPLAVKTAISKVAENHGIHFTNGKRLLDANHINTVMLDMSGTITEGKLTIKEQDCIILHPEKFTKEKLLQYVALLETGQGASRPMGKVILDFALKENEKIDADEWLQLAIEGEIDASCRFGIKGMINGQEFIVGSERILEANHIKIPQNLPQESLGHRTYIVCDREIVGTIVARDSVRHDAKNTLALLTKKFGENIHICTGASKETAEYYMHQLGYTPDDTFEETEQYYKNNSGQKIHLVPNCGTLSNEKNNLPNDKDEIKQADFLDEKKDQITKTDYLEDLKKKGKKVMMVGDSANDVDVITKADLGVAMISETSDNITQECAGVVIRDLSSIIKIFNIAEMTQNNIWQNLSISLIYNVAVTVVAAGLSIALKFTFTPVMGIALMVVESTIVLLNLLRFKKQEMPNPPQIIADASDAPKPRPSYTLLKRATERSPSSQSHALLAGTSGLLSRRSSSDLDRVEKAKQIMSKQSSQFT